MMSLLQPWDDIDFTVQMVGVTGLGLAGLTVQGFVSRDSDGLFLQPDGSWSVSGATLSFVELDATYHPGVYRLTPASTVLDRAARGYTVSVFEDTQSMRENYHVKAFVPSADRLLNDYDALDEDTLAEFVARTLALLGHNRSITWSDYVNGQPTTGTIKLYETPADVASGNNSKFSYEFGVQYNVNGTIAAQTQTKIL